MRRSVVLTTVLFALAAPPAAAGDGLPPTGTDAGPAGVTAPGSTTRYVTVRVRGHTLIARIARRGGRIVAQRIVPEPLVVPLVAYDGSSTGLAGDGRTLVLTRPRTAFPMRRSSFAVFSAKRLWPRATIALRGDFTLDAVSPDGDRLYLIHTNGASPTDYEVRAYDIRARRLLPDPIVDPEEPDEEMRGFPLARATSRDGRWAYTLYGANGDEQFIHALDTERGEAKCIDLPGVPPVDGLSLSGDGPLIVSAGTEMVRIVDTRTFAVRPPGPEPSPPRPRAGDASNRGWIGISAGVLLLVLLACGAVALGRRRVVRDNVQSYATAGLERGVVRTDVDAPGGNGTGGARPAGAERERART